MIASDAMMPKTLPGGGLASFLTSNMDEIDDSVLAFGRPAGINSMRGVAERMAQMGRGGDNFVVHASEREMMVPREVVEKNPQLREQIMQSIAAEGADPNAYIVGNEANSINPMTGQREFFLKKLVRGIKNVVKAVAPIVLPIVGTMILGPIYGAAAGSALNAAIQGGNARDIVRAGLTGGAIGGVMAGVSGAFQGARAGIGALPGAKAALSSALSPSNVFSNLGSRIAERGLFNAYQGPDFSALAQQQQAAQQAAAAPQQAAAPLQAPQTAPGATPGPAVAGPAAGPATSQPSIIDRLLGRTPGGEGMGLTGEARLAEINRLQAAYPNAPAAEIARLVDGAPRTLLQQYGPAAAGSLALAAATGAFNPIEQPPPSTPGYDQTSSELLAQNPQMYSPGVAGAPNFVTPGQVSVATAPGGVAVPMPVPIRPAPIQMPQFEPIRFAAQGGEMTNFPRRMGAIDGPGTETSDDVPAMLSDGEFVMTARAVRGAGAGDRQQGVRRMYDMMRMFEGGVAR
jgi:hypothetical protein